MDCQFGKIRTQSNSGSRVSGLSVQPSRRFGLPKSKEIGQAQNFGSFHFARSQHYSKEAHVTNWGHGFHGENSSFGSDPYETVSVVSEDQLAVSPVIGQGGPNFSVDKGPSGLVDGSSELTQGFESSSERTQYADVHRCIREGLGGSLEQLYCKWVLAAIRKRRLIASFHRDRPSANRSIPNWDLSLVLLALTRAPFEPLAKADLKILTFKTVFLLALASGKRRSEIHAWTFDSFSRKRDWSEVTFSPSTAFIAKNQLASEGPLAIQPVVIPALKPTLDPSLIQDKSLCPVRSLRFYLDKTKDLRKGKKLLFVAIKEGYSKDISKATISSSWKEGSTRI